MQEITHILFYVDGEEADLAVLERIADRARVSGAKLTLAAVVEPARYATVLTRAGLDLDGLQSQLVDLKQDLLARALDSIDTSGLETRARVLVGDPVASILEEAESQGVDLLGKTVSPPDGLRKQFLGAVDRQLLRTSTCPVGIRRSGTPEGAQTVVAAIDYDGDDEDNQALNDSILDSTLQALSMDLDRIHVIHAWSLYGYTLLAHGRGRIPQEQLSEAVNREQSGRQRWIDERIERYRSGLGKADADRFDPTVQLLRGDPRRVIPVHVNKIEADVLCMGTAMRQGIEGLLIGNTAEEILDRVECTVVVHKPKNSNR